MNLMDTLKVLTEHKADLTAMKIKSIAIFGSVARDQAKLDSDVDLLLEFSGPVGLFHFVRVRRVLSEMLGIRVDIVTKAALRNEMREEILREAVRAA